jgi:hypothetical protein
VLRGSCYRLAFALASLSPGHAEEAPRGLDWEESERSYVAKAGEHSVSYVFPFKNRSAGEITIHGAAASCGCTVAGMPEQPWKIAPGAGGELKVTMDLGGKAGRISKPVRVLTSEGEHVLTVVAELPMPAFPGAERMTAERIANVERAKSNRQSIFQGDCRSCHVDQGAGKLGRDLYQADCAICHESPQRAAMVPDLRAPKGPRNLSYWHNWISKGHPGSLMPAFAASEGGPLSQEQINSLVTYLARNYPDGRTAPAVSPVVVVPALPPPSAKAPGPAAPPSP